MQSHIRKCLETALYFKYFMHFQNIDHTLGAMINVIEGKNKLTESIIVDLKDLNNVSKAAQHGEGGNNPLQDLTREEIIPKIDKTLQILEII